MPQNKEEIHVIYLGDGETWDLAKECTLIFNLFMMSQPMYRYQVKIVLPSR
jgi:hypothetical protein